MATRSVLTLFLIIAVLHVVHCHDVRFYEHPNFQGEVKVAQSYAAHKEACQVLDKNWQGKISSVDSKGHCVYLYETTNCEKPGLRIAPGTPRHDDLGALSFNDKTVAYRFCCIKNYPVDKEKYDCPEDD